MTFISLFLASGRDPMTKGCQLLEDSGGFGERLGRQDGCMDRLLRNPGFGAAAGHNAGLVAAICFPAPRQADPYD